jgi:hypothetical protein
VAVLDVVDIARSQLVSARFLNLARDFELWKIRCFEDSRTEAARRRKRLRDARDYRLDELVNAISSLPGAAVASGAPPSTTIPDTTDRTQRSRALANWEPGYPGEKIDYYEEYIHRHADVNIDWINLPNSGSGDKREIREATGIGILSKNGDGTHHLVSPLDDGSICVWDVTARSTSSDAGKARLVGQSSAGLLTGNASSDRNHSLMTETGAVECVSIDGNASKGYFAVQNVLQEVDLQSLQVSSTRKYPFPITALSSCQPGMPLTVGTNSTVHLHDSRDPNIPSQASDSAQLIGGSIDAHATLSQPGPLSILNQHETSSIWVAGRFTSLLHYDIRRFPRLLGTIHSGARIASLTSLPHPFIPRSLDLIRNPDASASALQTARSEPGTTLLAAAEYKGKGSLELHDPSGQHSYQNRQTASASKLLSVAPHGGRIVFSDGDGNLRWMERDGSTLVRQYNINSDVSADASTGGIFSSSASEMPGQGDIVQKMLPLRAFANDAGSNRPDLPNESLMLWSGDGRIGCLNFGCQNPLKPDDSWHDAVEEQAVSAGERARADAEKQYDLRMRRALERNADEVRFVRGLGMASF